SDGCACEEHDPPAGGMAEKEEYPDPDTDSFEREAEHRCEQVQERLFWWTDGRSLQDHDHRQYQQELRAEGRTQNRWRGIASDLSPARPGRRRSRQGVGA